MSRDSGEALTDEIEASLARTIDYGGGARLHTRPTGDGGLSMSEPTSQAELLEAMLAARVRLDSLITRIPPPIMTRRGAAGQWSVKDILAHLTSYDRWLALSLALRGQKPPNFWIDDIPLDEFNRRLFEENRDRTLDEVLQESQDVWAEILAETRAHTEAYLFAEQSIPDVPYHFRPCDLLKSESYGHYLDHLSALEAWLHASQ